MDSKYKKTGKKRLSQTKETAIMLVGCLLILLAGCEDVNKVPTEEKIDTLARENEELKHKVLQFEAENEQLKKQIQVLSGIPSQAKPERLYDLKRVKIGRYTNLHDEDKDGKNEKLIVYLQPIDENGDIIKAAGAVDVQLWDLDKNDGQAMVGQWHVKPDELKKLWFATIITINYRLTFDVSEKIDTFNEPLTVKVTFTDYLNGKVFKEQKVIKPR